MTLLALLAIDAVLGDRGVLHLQRLHTQQQEAEAIAFRLADENRQRREDLDRREHDDAYLEQLARERLGWIRPGERLYRVRPGGADEASDQAPDPRP